MLQRFSPHARTSSAYHGERESMFHALIRAGSVAACISAGRPVQIHTRHRRLCTGGITDGIGFDPTPASAAKFSGYMKKGSRQTTAIGQAREITGGLISLTLPCPMFWWAGLPQKGLGSAWTIWQTLARAWSRRISRIRMFANDHPAIVPNETVPFVVSFIAAAVALSQGRHHAGWITECR